MQLRQFVLTFFKQLSQVSTLGVCEMIMGEGVRVSFYNGRWGLLMEKLGDTFETSQSIAKIDVICGRFTCVIF